MSRGTLLALILTSMAAAACQAPPPSPQATLAVVHARVWTSDPGRPWAEAVAVRGETLAAVGSDEEILAVAAALL